MILIAVFIHIFRSAVKHFLYIIAKMFYKGGTIKIIGAEKDFNSDFYVKPMVL